MRLGCRGGRPGSPFTVSLRSAERAWRHMRVFEFQTNVSSGPCTGPTKHVPGGPDGTGTCWPGPDNTGPNRPESSMAAYSGPCTITSPNTVIDSKVIRCSSIGVGPGASGLVIKNSYIYGSVPQSSGSQRRSASRTRSRRK